MQFILGPLTFPLNPEKFTVQSGAHVQTYAILDVGTMTFPRGREPQKVTFDGILPGASLQQFTDFVTGPPRDPAIITTMIEAWVAQGTTLLFYVPPTSLYLPSSFVESFRQSPGGGMGDVAFSITITERRPLAIETTSQFTAGSAPFQAQGLPIPPATYIPGSGETLMTVAKKLYGNSALWNIIYQANATAMGRYDAPIVGLPLTIPGGV